MKSKTVKIIAIVFSVVFGLICFISIRNIIMYSSGYSDFDIFIIINNFMPYFIVYVIEIIVLFLLASALKIQEKIIIKLGITEKPAISAVNAISKYIKSKNIKIIAVVFSILSGLICIFIFGYAIISGYYENNSFESLLVGFISDVLPYCLGVFILFALSATFKNREEIILKLDLENKTDLPAVPTAENTNNT